MKAVRLLLALLLVLLWGGALVYAKPEFAKKENKACTFCHVKAGSKDLNDAGKYYKEKGTLKGYKAPEKKK